MVEQGALDEVGRSARRLDPMLPVMRAHGVPGLLAHLRGEASLEEAIAAVKADTRRYAKRQFTWFRHQLPDWAWVAPEREASPPPRPLAHCGDLTGRAGSPRSLAASCGCLTRWLRVE